MCQILIVDDETSIREIVQDYVSTLGFKSRGAASAVEALPVLERNLPIRICLLDLHLPGIDGLTLCKKIKRIDPMMITIAMTGFKSLFSLVECRQAGFDDIIFKPFNLDLVKALLFEYDSKVKRWNKDGS